MKITRNHVAAVVSDVTEMAAFPYNHIDNSVVARVRLALFNAWTVTTQNAKVLGLYFRSSGRAVMNRNQGQVSIVFTALHEFTHKAIHERGLEMDHDSEEALCDIIAGHVLDEIDDDTFEFIAESCR